VIVATHDERLVPLADAIVNLTPRPEALDRPPRRYELAAGDVLFREGERGDEVFMVDDGAVDLVRHRVDGTEELLATVTAGGYFGELAPMLGLPRSATARAAAPTVLTGCSIRDFRERLGTDTSSGELLADAADATS
jgi:putative ABC transport system ATP-binding protein